MSIWNWFLARSRLTPVRIILGSLSLFILSALYVLYALLIMRVPDEFPELASMAVLFSCIIWILPKLHRRRRISDVRDVVWLHGIPAGLLLFGLGNGALSEPVVLLV